MINLVITETKRPSSLDQLQTLVQSHTNEDFNITLGDLSIDGDHVMLNDKRHMLRHNGLKGLLSKIGMPISYAQKIPTDLFRDSVNRLIKTYGDTELLVRVQDSEVRAILSPNYVALDCKDLVKHARKAVDVGLGVERISYDGDSAVIQMISKTEVKAKEVGDISKIGVSLSTSDTGLTHLEAAPFVYRMICTNGSIIPTSLGGGVHFIQKDVNPATAWEIFGESYAKILDRMSKIDNNFLINLENVKVTAANFVQVKNKLSEHAGSRKVSEILGKVEEEITNHGTEFSIFNIWNIVTESARDSHDMHIQHSLEIASGELLMEYGAKN